MSEKADRFRDYDITTRAVHTGNDYDKETGAVRRPLHMANSYKLPDDLSKVNYSSTDLLFTPGTAIPTSTGSRRRSRLSTARRTR